MYHLTLPRRGIVIRTIRRQTPVVAILAALTLMIGVGAVAGLMVHGPVSGGPTSEKVIGATPLGPNRAMALNKTGSYPWCVVDESFLGATCAAK